MPRYDAVDHLEPVIAAWFNNNFTTTELHALEIAQKAGISTQLTCLRTALDNLVACGALKVRILSGVRLYSRA